MHWLSLEKGSPEWFFLLCFVFWFIQSCPNSWKCGQPKLRDAESIWSSPQPIHGWAWGHRAGVVVWGSFHICEASRMEDLQTGKCEIPTWRAFCGFGWREDLAARVHENNNILPAGGAECLVSSRKMLLHVLSLARPLCSPAEPEQPPGMTVGWRGNVQAELQRADSMGILKHKCVFFCHPTTWFWVLSFCPAIFFLCCNYCWECDPACWLWCHAHFLCRQPSWVAGGDF